MLTLAHFLTLGAILFSIGVAGIFLNRKNIIILLMSIELMLLAVNMNFIAFSRFLDNMDGQIFVFFILTVAAAEAAVVDDQGGQAEVVQELQVVRRWPTLPALPWKNSTVARAPGAGTNQPCRSTPSAVVRLRSS